MGTFVHLSVSADGSTFLDGLSVDNANGRSRPSSWCNFPGDLRA